MNSEPFFVLDEELEQVQENLNSLMFEIKHPKVKKQAVILNTFVRACAETLKKPDYKLSFLPQTKESPTIKRIEKKVPIGYTVWPIPKPGSTRVEKFEAKAKFKDVKIERIIPASHRELIIDRFSNKVMASAIANSKYIVTEPKLSNNEIKVVTKILNMYPKDMKVAWDLIKKEGVDDDAANKIKYYIANELFAMGKIEPLLHDPDINMIKCDGVGKLVRVKYRGKELKTNFLFKDKKILENFIYNIARKLGKDVNEEEPIVDTVHRKFRIQLILGLRTNSKFVFKRVE